MTTFDDISIVGSIKDTFRPRSNLADSRRIPVSEVLGDNDSWLFRTAVIWISTVKTV